MLRSRYDFPVRATVETGVSVDFQEARAWSLKHDRETGNLQGRVLPHRLHPESEWALWEFEFDADAILFNLRFGGVARGPLDVSIWRNEMLRI